MISERRPGLSERIAGLFEIPRAELAKALAMAGLFFLIILTVGIIKPIKNAFALDGLADSQFYRVYLISAAVVLFVLPYNRLADRIPWRRLIPLIAAFFAANLIAFRLLYRSGSTAFGVVFYGWYDLYSAVMVTQFFMATQLFFNARAAKRWYPLAIAGGSLGGVFGSAITGFFAETVGGPNLLLVAAVAVAIFAVAIPFVLAKQGRRDSVSTRARKEKLTAGEFGSIVRNRHVLLIALAVLLTVLVKQLVDYQFNEITKEVFIDRDAIGAFQGKFFAVTQWLPLIVLVALRPLLRRFGVGLVVLMLPAALLLANLALAISWSLVAAIAAKASDSAFRYTAERAGREILYVPLPETIKLKAKAYIDMAVEKGFGKVLSAGLIFVVILVVDYRKVGYVGVALGVVWLGVSVAVGAEYVRSLTRSVRDRFASFEGVFALMSDASTLPAVEGAIKSGDDRSIAFALDLVDQAEPASVRTLTGSLQDLLDHPTPTIRERALTALSAFPDEIDTNRVRRALEDPAESVRRAAVAALCRAGDAPTVIEELLRSPRAEVRLAALACLADGAVEAQRVTVEAELLESRLRAARAGEVEAKIEMALISVALGDDSRVPEVLGPLLRDSDPRVASTALRTAGRLGRREFLPRIIASLKPAATREAARKALVMQGERVEGTLSDYLQDESVDHATRRQIPAVMARIPAQSTADDLLRFLGSVPRDLLLRQRLLKALNNLRTMHPELKFDPDPIGKALDAEIEASARYTRARLGLAADSEVGPVGRLLEASLSEAERGVRERAFRLLGLLHPPREIYHTFLILESGGVTARATALEWLEQTVGRSLFARMAPVLQGAGESRPPFGRRPEPRELLVSLIGDENAWVASLAVWSVFERRAPWSREELQRAQATASAQASYMAERALARLGAAEGVSGLETEEMNLIEKVFLLQQVDLLHEARSEELATLASIAEEIEVDPGTLLLSQDEPTDALYVVISGAVELRRAGEQVMTAKDGTPFGTWALIDESPSLVSATALETSRLLRITREDFYDLLAEHNELVRGLLKGLARRVRKLVA